MDYINTCDLKNLNALKSHKIMSFWNTQGTLAKFPDHTSPTFSYLMHLYLHNFTHCADATWLADWIISRMRKCTGVPNKVTASVNGNVILCRYSHNFIHNDYLQYTSILYRNKSIFNLSPCMHMADQTFWFLDRVVLIL